MNRKIVLFALAGLLLASSLFAEVKIPRRLFYIQSVAARGTDKGFWDLPGYNPSYERGANLALYQKEEGNIWDRLYMFQSVGDGWYRIVPANGGSVDVSRGNTDNGTNVLVWERHDGNNQKFRLEHVGGDRFKIYTWNGQVLATANRSIENDTNVHIWADHDVPATMWYLIERHSGRPFHVNAPVQPFGSVVNRRTGEPVSGAAVTVINTNDRHDKRYTVATGRDGSFSFNPLESVKYGYDIVISAPGYGSVTIDSHKQRINGPHDVELEPADDYLQVEFGRFGTWLYEKRVLDDPSFSEWDIRRKYYSYIDGETETDHDFYFPDNVNRSKTVLELMETIGLDGTPAVTDEEIYVQLKKVWRFWRENSRAVGLSQLSPADQAAVDSLYLPSPLERWPSVLEYAEVFRDHGFIPAQNCTSNTMGFAALMSLTGIDRSKMAVEVMHMTTSVMGEHWAFLIRLKGVWYWIDPQARSMQLKPLDSFWSIPPRVGGAAYDKPFRIVTFPGSEELGVPLCGWKVKPERETGIYWDTESPHLAYASVRFSGTEPFWSLTMDNTDKIVFTPTIGAQEQEFRVVSLPYTPQGNGLRITAEHTEREPWLPGGTIPIHVMERETVDDMSGKMYPYFIRLKIDGKTYEGVGWKPEPK